MGNQMQVSTVQPIVEPILFPETLQFGHVTLTNDFQLFLEAIECAIDGHMEIDSNTRTMSTRQLLAFFKSELDYRDDDVPRYWRIWSLVGEIIGFLYPTLNTDNPSHTYLESLSRTFLERSRQEK